LTDTVAQKRGVISVKDVKDNHIVYSQMKTDRLKARERRNETIRRKKTQQHGKAIAKRFGLMNKKVIT
jgi:hypothetical protein